MNDKKLLLINEALKLFYARGINSIGINEILKQSGVAKKTLYNHFASKEELVLATLHYRDMIFCQWFESIFNDQSTGTDAMLAIFYALDDWFNNRVIELDEFKGCFFINTAAEYGDHNAPARQLCKAHKNKIKVLIQAKLSLFIKNEELCQQLTQTICLLKEGAIVSASVEGDVTAGLKCLPIVRQLIREGC
ncbi:TetR/AcrR family transcriptional regulator [Colwellia asteriadis]|uniref:TetR/AcrR family transcriptional regulator n=1 Tax=Colwellia asteriadis TaxID=517723 RepID=A0ABN1L7M1_9GAMM